MLRLVLAVVAGVATQYGLSYVSQWALLTLAQDWNVVVPLWAFLVEAQVEAVIALIVAVLVSHGGRLPAKRSASGTVAP